MKLGPLIYQLLQNADKAHAMLEDYKRAITLINGATIISEGCVLGTFQSATTTTGPRNVGDRIFPNYVPQNQLDKYADDEVALVYELRDTQLEHDVYHPAQIRTTTVQITGMGKSYDAVEEAMADVSAYLDGKRNFTLADVQVSVINLLDEDSLYNKMQSCKGSPRSMNLESQNPNTMIEITLAKTWNIKSGVSLPAGTTLQVAEVYYHQLHKAGMLHQAEEENKNENFE